MIQLLREYVWECGGDGGGGASVRLILIVNALSYRHRAM